MEECFPIFSAQFADPRF